MTVPAAPPGPRERNRRGEGGRLRTDILDAASALLDESGDEHAVTLRAVARRVGIAAPSIYGHFAGRQAILLAIVQQAFAELDAAVAGAEAAAGPDPVARLRAACAAYLDFAESQPQRYRLVFGGLWDAARALEEAAITEDEAAALGRAWLGVLASGLRACVAAGRSSSTEPATDAVALWLGLHGLAHQRAVAPLFDWPPDVADRLVASLAHLDPRPTGGPAPG